MKRTGFALTATLAGLIAGCGDTANLSIAQGTGPAPRLPPPTRTLLPTVNLAPAVGWPAGRMPTPATGLQVNAFAAGLAHPRWLLVLPNGDVLVAESAAPPKPPGLREEGGLRAMFMRMFMRQAGSAVPSANRITLLRDADGDGIAEGRSAFLTGLNSPFGMARVGDTLYVANANALLAFPYSLGATSVGGPGRIVTPLPAGRNHHWTKSLVASPDGRRLYVGVGSNSNVAEHGLHEEAERAAIWEIDPGTGAHNLFATGLRNPVGSTSGPARRTCSLSSMSATSSAATSFPITSPASSVAASTAGRGAISDATSIRG